MMLLALVAVVYVKVVLKISDADYVFLLVVSFVLSSLASLLAPFHNRHRLFGRGENQNYEQVPGFTQNGAFADYAMGMNVNHLQLTLREGDFGADDYEELLRLDENAGVNHGLHQTQIERFPRHIHTYKESKKSKLFTCAVCLENIEDGDEIRTITCMHQFHVNCIDKWLRSKPTCPVCMFPVQGGNDPEAVFNAV